MENSFNNDCEISSYMDLHSDNETSVINNILGSEIKDRPPRNFEQNGHLRSVREMPQKYRDIFRFPYFNVIQSHVFDDVFYSDKPLVLLAPTGSGKTVIFELAIIRLLMNFEDEQYSVAPVKALCNEKLQEWHLKFSKIGLSCLALTGDSDIINYSTLKNYHIIITTPEKWDSITRNINDKNHITADVKLFMIDEIHLLNEETRGPVLEAIVCRMKILQKSINIRFLALSATIPNIEDIAQWLGSEKEPAIFFRISDEMRPVKLKKVVLGYACSPNTNAFRFDLSLNYKLRSVLMNYADGKPAVVFCSTRKGVELASKQIYQDTTFHLTPDQSQRLDEVSKTLMDNTMRAHLKNGIGCHHAGMTPENRVAVEALFREGHLPVLLATSTLAMGVNLPAHLVVIKSTQHYVNGEIQDYSESNLMQMLGRAGRPQYDTEATVVIMTKMSEKTRYERKLGGTELIESNLHRHLVEHLNSEIVLKIITDISVAFEWIKYTFLYVRVFKNPKHYNMPTNLTKEKIDKKLEDLCQIEINALNRFGMLQIDQEDGFTIYPTDTGCLMANYYLDFKTMKLFTQIKGTESLSEMLTVLAECEEFSESYLRVNDKKTLNTLNRCKFQSTIRFALSGNIKTTAMKINCIIQATFGSLEIKDPSLRQESVRIMRTGDRLSKCFYEYLLKTPKSFSAILSSLILYRCFQTKMWENSPYITKQLPKIGTVLSSMLAQAGKISFKSILEENPRHLERIINRIPPMGNEIQELVSHIPFYKITVKPPANDGLFKVNVVVTLINSENIQENCTVPTTSHMILLIGDSENNLLLHKKLSHSLMAAKIEHCENVNVISNKNHEIRAYLISENWVGIDCEASVEIKVRSETIQNTNLKNNIDETNSRLAQKIFTPVVQKNLTSYFKETKSITNNRIVNPKFSQSAINKNVSRTPSIKSFFSKRELSSENLKSTSVNQQLDDDKIAEKENVKQFENSKLESISSTNNFNLTEQSSNLNLGNFETVTKLNTNKFDDSQIFQNLKTKYSNIKQNVNIRDAFSNLQNAENQNNSEYQKLDEMEKSNRQKSSLNAQNLKNPKNLLVSNNFIQDNFQNCDFQNLEILDKSETQKSLMNVHSFKNPENQFMSNNYTQDNIPNYQNSEYQNLEKLDKLTTQKSSLNVQHFKNPENQLMSNNYTQVNTPNFQNPEYQNLEKLDKLTTQKSSLNVQHFKNPENQLMSNNYTQVNTPNFQNPEYQNLEKLDKLTTQKSSLNVQHLKNPENQFMSNNYTQVNTSNFQNSEYQNLEKLDKLTTQKSSLNVQYLKNPEDQFKSNNYTQDKTTHFQNPGYRKLDKLETQDNKISDFQNCRDINTVFEANTKNPKKIVSKYLIDKINEEREHTFSDNLSKNYPSSTQNKKIKRQFFTPYKNKPNTDTNIFDKNRKSDNKISDIESINNEIIPNEDNIEIVENDRFKENENDVFTRQELNELRKIYDDNSSSPNSCENNFNNRNFENIDNIMKQNCEEQCINNNEGKNSSYNFDFTDIDFDEFENSDNFECSTSLSTKPIEVPDTELLSNKVGEKFKINDKDFEYRPISNSNTNLEKYEVINTCNYPKNNSKLFKQNIPNQKSSFETKFNSNVDNLSTYKKIENDTSKLSQFQHTQRPKYSRDSQYQNCKIENSKTDKNIDKKDEFRNSTASISLSVEKNRNPHQTEESKSEKSTDNKNEVMERPKLQFPKNRAELVENLMKKSRSLSNEYCNFDFGIEELLLGSEESPDSTFESNKTTTSDETNQDNETIENDYSNVLNNTNSTTELAKSLQKISKNSSFSMNENNPYFSTQLDSAMNENKSRNTNETIKLRSEKWSELEKKLKTRIQDCQIFTENERDLRDISFSNHSPEIRQNNSGLSSENNFQTHKRDYRTIFESKQNLLTTVLSQNNPRVKTLSENLQKYLDRQKTSSSSNNFQSSTETFNKSFSNMSRFDQEKYKLFSQNLNSNQKHFSNNSINDEIPSKKCRLNDSYVENGNVSNWNSTKSNSSEVANFDPQNMNISKSQFQLQTHKRQTERFITPDCTVHGVVETSYEFITVTLYEKGNNSKSKNSDDKSAGSSNSLANYKRNSSYKKHDNSSQEFYRTPYFRD